MGYIPPLKKLRLALASSLMVLGMSSVSVIQALDPASAAKPEGGTVSPAQPVVLWKGEEATFSSRELGPCPERSTCDDFQLQVDVPPSYWDEHTGGVKVKLSWEHPNHFEFDVYDALGNLVAGNHRNPQPNDPTAEAVIPNASGTYTVRAIYYLVTNASYEGEAAFVAEEGAIRRGAGAFFDSSTPLEFGPATIVSAHHLGSEPQVVIERPAEGAPSGVLDPKRIFIDWPLSSRAQIGQLTRSPDEGDSFRLLFDPLCAQRSRPTCQTGGGGDSATAVNPFNGHVYFSDQQALVTNELIASSTDHGDSFPQERQFTISNAATITDRQWLTAVDPRPDHAITIDVGGIQRRIDAFLSYRIVGSGQYIQGIDESGAPIPQPVMQIPSVHNTGALAIDNSSGPGSGWLYQAYGTPRPRVATAHATRYRERDAWSQTLLSDEAADIFIWLDLDSEGNAYATWAEGDGAVYYSASPIHDVRNHPEKEWQTEDGQTAGGRPGTYWTPPLRLTPPSITSSQFPEVTAGDPGRIAITYDGTSDHTGGSRLAGDDAKWHTYAAVVTNALGENGPPVVHTGQVSHRLIHTGNIDGLDHTLLDMIDIDHVEDGRVAVTFTDNHSTFASKIDIEGDETKPFVHFAKQIGGPSLVEGSAAKDSGGSTEPAGDATWPNRQDGDLLPTLDLTDTSLSLEGERVVARIDLSSMSNRLRRSDLGIYNDVPASTPEARRAVYLVRFTTESEIFHMAVEFPDDGPPRPYGGRLDSNDHLEHGAVTIGAAYRPDPGYEIQHRIDGNSLELTAPVSNFGLSSGDALYSITGFTMIGPKEQDETALNPMRTIDATAPLDLILRSAERSPSPDPSPASENEAANISLSPENAKARPGQRHVFLATISDADGAPVEGVSIDWASEGVGTITDRESVTDEQGSARAEVASEARGNQLVRASTSCGESSCEGAASMAWGPLACDVLGTDENDFIEGTAADEVICGFSGNDVILGGGGNDRLLGGPGSDRFFGEGGDDLILGRSGDDRLDGGTGHDRLKGGAGGDQIKGERGRDVLRGGLASDFLLGGVGRDKLFGGSGSDDLRGGSGRDRCRPSPGERTTRC